MDKHSHDVNGKINITGKCPFRDLNYLNPALSIRIWGGLRISAAAYPDTWAGLKAILGPFYPALERHGVPKSFSFIRFSGRHMLVLPGVLSDSVNKSILLI